MEQSSNVSKPGSPKLAAKANDREPLLDGDTSWPRKECTSIATPSGDHESFTTASHNSNSEVPQILGKATLQVGTQILISEK